jgi:16S rRNA processing protein RimM
MPLQSQSNEFVTLGKISGVFGVKGWLKVYSHTAPREGILKYSPWYLKQAQGWTAIKVKTGHKQGKTLVVQLEGVNDRNLAESMIGLEIAVKAAQLPHLTKNEYYWSDLAGLQVSTIDGTVFGVVDYVFATGANDVLVVKKSAGGECLIPFVGDEVIKSVDLVNAMIQVDWDPEL